MPKKSSPNKINTSKIIRQLSQKSQAARQNFKDSHGQAYHWLKTNNLDLKDLRSHSKKLLTSGAVAGTLLLSPPSSFDNLHHNSTVKQRLDKLNFQPSPYIQAKLASSLNFTDKQPFGHLVSSNQQQLETFLQQNYGIKASNQLEGNQLNHSLGIIGLEQHLKRFPGDSLNLHDEELQAGIAPGLGAWGYFTYSKDNFTSLDYLREKYYFAVQTMYLPNWTANHHQLTRWYQYRKMLAINPANGSMVVGVVADTGPADWTGKQFGGSPEIIQSLGLKQAKKGKIILLFIDDPDNQVPLGPLTTPLNQPTEIV